MVERSFCDFVLTGDFRYPGGTSSAIAEEIKVLKDSRWTWRVDQFDSRVFIRRPINEKIAALVEREDYLPEDGEIGCRTWFIHNPHCLLWGIPERRLKADRIIVVAHQAPVSFTGKFYYDPWKIDDLLRASHPESTIVWAPISPLCRKMFNEIGFDRNLLDFDWFNVFSGAFKSPRDLARELPIRIGCHGRSQSEKWPATREIALKVYPDHPDFKVTLLGADPVSSGPIAPFPARWKTYRFGEMDVADFLNEIDFFVYCPRPDWVETFGRTIAEAILSGKLAVLPRSLIDTFGDLAIYADPDNVQDTVRSYWNRPEDYHDFVRAASSKAASLYGAEGLKRRFDRVAADGSISHRGATSNNCSMRTRARRDSSYTAFKHSFKLLAKRALMVLTRGRLKY